jgi:cell division protein FtsI/penicillin-binding protein 2
VISSRRLITLAVVILIPMLAVLVRSFWLVAVPPQPPEGEKDRKTQMVYRSSPRGTIYDTNGTVMAVSNRALLIRMDTSVVSTTVAIAKAAQYIAPAVSRNVDVIQRRMEAILKDSKAVTPTMGNIVYTNIAPQAMALLSDTLTNEDKGVTVEKIWMRNYPLGSIAGPTLGFVSNEPKGYSGVEGYYEQELQSSWGIREQEGPMDIITVTQGKAGARLVLTLDTVLQAYVEEQLAKGIKDYEAVGGSIIVMETHTGAILASASWPGFDPNNAIDLASTKGPMSLVDPVVSVVYEPGSVYKLLTIASALDAGTVSITSTFMDNGSFVVDGRTIRNSDRVAHGVVDLTETLQESLNVVAAQISTGMGPQKFYEHFHRFGIASRTGVDIAYEATGSMRTPATDEIWSRADLATNSFGQGLDCTPLQVLNAVNAIANDGLLMQPYVVQQWVTEDGKVVNRRPTAIGQAISPETARVVRKISSVASRNATPELRLSGYTVAGKTGTASWYLRGMLQDTTIVTYVGWLPANNPRLTILVKLDQPKTSPWAKETTIPIFVKVAARAASLMGIPPDIMKEDR